MITANMANKCGWETYRIMILVPLLGKHLIPEQGNSSDPPLKAYVNHGRWIAKCECGGAEKVWDEGWMLCQSCLNAAHGHRYRSTVFPGTRQYIEALLARRPLPNRNWYPGETLKQLEAENEIHAKELL